VTITLDFWWLFVILVAIGVTGFLIISMLGGGAYDFVTPFLAIGWALIFIILAIGLAIGKYVF
jgi:hypothetical protein